MSSTQGMGLPLKKNANAKEQTPHTLVILLLALVTHPFVVPFVIVHIAHAHLFVHLLHFFHMLMHGGAIIKIAVTLFFHFIHHIAHILVHLAHGFHVILHGYIVAIAVHHLHTHRAAHHHGRVAIILHLLVH